MQKQLLPVTKCRYCIVHNVIMVTLTDLTVEKTNANATLDFKQQKMKETPDEVVSQKVKLSLQLHKLTDQIMLPRNFKTHLHKDR